MGKGEYSFIYGGIADLHSHRGNQYGSSSGIGIDLTQDLAIPLRGIYLKDALSYHTDTHSDIFIAALFIMDRN